VAVSEDLARGTSLCLIDLGEPHIVRVEKRSNSAGYSETLSTLAEMGPQEILMEENRRGGMLARVITNRFVLRDDDDADDSDGDNENGNSSNNNNSSKTTVIRYIARSEFDQTRGAEMLQRLVRPTSWNPEVVMEVSE